MKVPFEKAVEDLGMSPVELAMRLANLTAAYDEIYPTIDEGLVDTLRQMLAERYYHKTAVAQSTLHKSTKGDGRPKQPLSAPERAILHVLHKKACWNTHRLSETVLRKLSHTDHFDDGLRALVGRGFLAHGKGDSYSLNLDSKNAIEAALKP